MLKIKYFLLFVFITFFTACEKNFLVPDLQFMKIHFHYFFKNELNTFEQTYQKDLVMDGTTKIPFWLTTDEQEQILTKVQEVNFFQFPDTIQYEPESDSIMVVHHPNPGIQFLRIQYQEQDKTVYWYPYLPDDTEYVSQLRELTNLIIEIIESKPEYHSLPPALGMYA